MNAPANVCILVAQYGIGDHYIVAGFAEAVARQGGPVLTLHPFRALKVGLVASELPGVMRLS